MSDDAKKSISERYRTRSYARRVSTRAITIDDVARAAQVSTGRSRVLNGTRDVSTDRGRGCERPSWSWATSPSGPPGRSGDRPPTCGRSSSPTSRTRSSRRSCGASRTAVANMGFRLMLCNSDEERAQGSRPMSTWAIVERMTGVVIAVASTRTSPDRSRCSTPASAVVAVDRRPGGHKVDCVLVDNDRGAAEATAHLIAAGSMRCPCASPDRNESAPRTSVSGGYRQRPAA